jgi:hypothetical protein
MSIGVRGRDDDRIEQGHVDALGVVVVEPNN